MSAATDNGEQRHSTTFDRETQYIRMPKVRLQLDRLAQLVSELPALGPPTTDDEDDEFERNLALLHTRCQSLMEMQSAVRTLHRQTRGLEEEFTNTAYKLTTEHKATKMRQTSTGQSRGSGFSVEHDRIVTQFNSNWQSAVSNFNSGSPSTRSKGDMSAGLVANLVRRVTHDSFSLGAGIAMLEDQALREITVTGSELPHVSPLEVLVDTTLSVSGPDGVIKLGIGAFETAVRELVGRDICVVADRQRKGAGGADKAAPDVRTATPQLYSRADFSGEREMHLLQLLFSMLDILDKSEIPLNVDEHQALDRVDQHVRTILSRQRSAKQRKPRPVAKDTASRDDTFHSTKPKPQRPSASPIIDTLSALSTYPFTTAAHVSDFVRSGSKVDLPPPLPPKPLASPSTESFESAGDEREMTTLFDLFATCPARSYSDVVINKLLSESFPPDCTSSDGPALHAKAQDILVKHWWTNTYLPSCLRRAAFGFRNSHGTLPAGVTLRDGGALRYSCTTLEERGKEWSPQDDEWRAQTERLIHQLQHSFLNGLQQNGRSSPAVTAAQNLSKAWSYHRHVDGSIPGHSQIRAFQVSASSAHALSKHFAPIMRFTGSDEIGLNQPSWPLVTTLYARVDSLTSTTVFSSNIFDLLNLLHHRNDQDAMCWSEVDSRASSPASELLNTPIDGCTLVDPIKAAGSCLNEAEITGIRNALIELIRSGAWYELDRQEHTPNGRSWLLSQLERAQNRAVKAHHFSRAVEVSNTRRRLLELEQKGFDLAHVLQIVSAPLEEARQDREQRLGILREMLGGLGRQFEDLKGMARRERQQLENLRIRNWFDSTMRREQSMVDPIPRNRQTSSLVFIKPAEDPSLYETLYALSDKVSRLCRPREHRLFHLEASSEQNSSAHGQTLTSFGLSPSSLANCQERARSRTGASEAYWNNVAIQFVDLLWVQGNHSDGSQMTKVAADEDDWGINRLLHKFAHHSVLTARLDAILELELVLSALTSSPQLSEVAPHVSDIAPQSLPLREKTSNLDLIGLGILGLESRVPQICILDSTPPITRVRTERFPATTEPPSTDTLLTLLESVIVSCLNLVGSTPRRKLDEMLKSAQTLSTLLGQHTMALDRGMRAKAFCDIACVLLGLVDRISDRNLCTEQAI
ncbi:hypothetical protein OIV83_004557 [Microbotryomycetes sp. JL201]|nr:hypothetical protein OIV83_004557 [Microbotryomycetes sp. JL201]